MIGLTFQNFLWRVSAVSSSSWLLSAFSMMTNAMMPRIPAQKPCIKIPKTLLILNILSKRLRPRYAIKPMMTDAEKDWKRVFKSDREKPECSLSNHIHSMTQFMICAAEKPSASMSTSVPAMSSTLKRCSMKYRKKEMLENILTKTNESPIENTPVMRLA